MILKLHQRVFPLLILIPVFLSLLTSCGGKVTSSSNNDLAMAPMAGMPADVRSAPTTVQQAYQFAAANPDVMQQIPCYCGCGKIGHTSNYSCYVDNVDEKGVITFDTHALGCSICVDITQDAMRLLREGKSVSEIKASVDQTYSQYGPSNIP